MGAHSQGETHGLKSSASGSAPPRQPLWSRAPLPTFPRILPPHTLLRSLEQTLIVNVGRRRGPCPHPLLTEKTTVRLLSDEKASSRPEASLARPPVRVRCRGPRAEVRCPKTWRPLKTAAACVACRAPGSGPLPPPACTHLSLGTAGRPELLSPQQRRVLMLSPSEHLRGSGSACDLLVQAMG